MNINYKPNTRIFLFAISSLVLFSMCTGNSDPVISSMHSPAPQNSELPFLYSDNAGNTFLSWVERGSGESMFKLMYSKLNDNNWAIPSEISRSDSWFVNWADYPSIIAYSGDAIAAHTLQKIPGNTYSYNVNIILNENSDKWGDPFVLHNDSTATEHGFVSMVPIGKNKFWAAWLDGRRTEDRSDKEYFNLNKAMTLRAAFIDSSGTIGNRSLIDDSVCDCCQTSMVMTDKGPFIAYRNRTGDEIRDIYYSRYEGGSWTEPAPVFNDEWKIGACPVNGPKVAAKDSLVAVAWYTGAGEKSTVKTAVSNDYGKTFGVPIIINREGTSGRVDIEITDQNTIFVSDINKDKDTYYLTAHKVNLEERSVTSHRISELSGSRRSGFPQMELVEEKLIFAWTDVKNDTVTQVQTAALKF